MSVEENFTLAPAHAHLNLVGGMLLFPFWLYYRMVPPAGTTTLAKVLGWLDMIGAVLFPAGVAVGLLKGPSFTAAPIAGSLVVVAAMALFAVAVRSHCVPVRTGLTVSPTLEAAAVLAIAAFPRAAVAVQADAVRDDDPAWRRTQVRAGRHFLSSTVA
jgi:hypothetical protein